MMTIYEKEVKFYLQDSKSEADFLRATCPRKKDRIFEYNVRLEDKSHSLKGKEILLRLRRDRRATLTCKCRDTMCRDSDVKVLKEMEVEVSSFETAMEIFSTLGFEKAQVYEKYRETFWLNQAVVTLDTLPYGEFMEIEAETGEIKKTARDLGLSWEDRIRANYLALFEAVKAEWDLPFNDLTFDNFKDLDMDFSPVLCRFRAGFHS